ncbi:unnamed protein product [Tenebrio molitor]|nr:unnamed protein product [Tenebrio molitor]
MVIDTFIQVIFFSGIIIRQYFLASCGWWIHKQPTFKLFFIL